MQVRRVAVLGAGVMGAQIAAHFVNAGLEVRLFDLAASEGDPNVLIKKSIKALGKLKPAPLISKSLASAIQVGNYEHDLDKLQHCDLVIEAISEQLSWKLALLEKVSPYIAEHAVLATNTSGLSISKMAEALPEKIAKRFCGVHFFNPPRYMRLVELVPHPKSDLACLDGLETFFVSRLGKGVVRAKDTPNFVGNRIGVFSLLATLEHADRLGIPPDVVDALTGPLIGRPKSATFRTMDVVGLDTLKHVVQTMQDNLPSDPWSRYFHVPQWIQALIDKGSLGQKTRRGIYAKQGKEIHVLDPKVGEYRLACPASEAPIPAAFQSKNRAEALLACRNSDQSSARLLWLSFLEVFQYAAYHLSDIAENVRDVDTAMRWGFAWKQGPFEIAQSIGWETVCQALAEAHAKDQLMLKLPLPEWIQQVEHVYADNQSYSVQAAGLVSPNTLPVYQQHHYPEGLLGESPADETIIQETDHTKLWHGKDKVAVLQFKTKRNCISDGVLQDIQNALVMVAKGYQGLVLFPGHQNDFSVGADLKGVLGLLKANEVTRLNEIVKHFQETALAIRYAPVPVVSALKGLVLGGGCELSLHCDAICAAQETYMGLPEVGVGLIPAGGGTKEMAMRLASETNLPAKLEKLQKVFENLAMGKVSSSAYEAQTWGYLRETDSIVMDSAALLATAKAKVQALSVGYVPPGQKPISALGDAGYAVLESLLLNLKAGGQVSEQDYLIANHLAQVLTSKGLDAGTLLPEAWYLQKEREVFVTLAQTEKSQARIAHTLATGKPLRN